MSRHKKNPLRTLTPDERLELGTIARSRTCPAALVVRAKIILAVADGADYQQAAHSVGRKSGDAVAQLVARFNTEGCDALQPRHGGGRQPIYDQADKQRILQEVARTPTPEADGTATWTLSMLRDHLRQAPDGLPEVSTFTLWNVLHEAGLSYQRTRTWCPTGKVLRKRKAGIVTVTDPDAEAKKN